MHQTAWFADTDDAAVVQVLPAVVDQIVEMIKAELRRSGVGMRQAADRYVDAVVTNAVHSVRGRLDVRQRQASRAELKYNGNRSNSSRSAEQDKQSSSEKYTNNNRPQQRRSKDDEDEDDDDDDDEDDDDDDYDDDDDISMSTYPFSDEKNRSDIVPSKGSSRSTSVCAVTEDRSTAGTAEHGRQTPTDCAESSSKYDKMSDGERDSENDRRSRGSKDSDKGNPVWGAGAKEDGGGKLQLRDGQQKPQRERGGILKDSCQWTMRDIVIQTERNKRDGDGVPGGRGSDPVVNDDSDDAMRWLRRDDNESVESYLVRSILLLGSLVNQSNHSSGPATSVRSLVDQAVDEAVESAVHRVDSRNERRPVPRTGTGQPSPGDDNRRVSHDGRRPGTSVTIQPRSAAARGRNRFMSTSGSRYSGNLSTYVQDATRWGRSDSSGNTSSFSATKFMEWVTAPVAYQPQHKYRSNRTDRERFSTRSSLRGATATAKNVRSSFGDNSQMRSNLGDKATSATERHGEVSPPRGTAGDAADLNTNNSRLQARSSNDRSADTLATAVNSDDFINTDRIDTKVAQSSVRSPAGTGKAFNSNNNNNNAVRSTYSSVTTISRADCTVINEEDSFNEHSVTGERSIRRSVRRHHGAGRSRGSGRRSTAALKAVSCSAMEADAFLRQLDSERLYPDVRLLVRVLDQYRNSLGLAAPGDDSLEADRAARRLARSPAGRWVITELLKHAQEFLLDVGAVQPSTYCRPSGLSGLGLAMMDGVDDDVTSQLVGRVSAELEDIALERAVTSVVQTLVDKTSSQHRHRHHRHRQQSV